MYRHRKIDTVHQRHYNVTENNLWLKLFDLIHGIFAICSFPDDGKSLFFPMYHIAQSLPHDKFVIDNQNTDTFLPHSKHPPKTSLSSIVHLPAPR